MNISKAKTEMSLNTNELEALKVRMLGDRVTPLALEGLSAAALKQKAEQLWKQIVQVETDKYDLTERSKRQEYDVGLCPSQWGDILGISMNLFFPASVEGIERASTPDQPAKVHCSGRGPGSQRALPAQGADHQQVRAPHGSSHVRRSQGSL